MNSGTSSAARYRSASGENPWNRPRRSSCAPGTTRTRSSVFTAGLDGGVERDGAADAAPLWHIAGRRAAGPQNGTVGALGAGGFALGLGGCAGFGFGVGGSVFDFSAGGGAALAALAAAAAERASLA